MGRHITAEICAPASLRVKYTWPDGAMPRLEISPSTQTFGNRPSMQSLMRRVNSETVRTWGGGFGIPPVCLAESIWLVRLPQTGKHTGMRFLPILLIALAGSAAGKMNEGETVADAAVPQNKAMGEIQDVP